MEALYYNGFRLRNDAEELARRIGWLLDLGHQWEYHLVYCDEGEVAAFRRTHCSGRP